MRPHGEQEYRLDNVVEGELDRVHTHQAASGQSLALVAVPFSSCAARLRNRNLEESDGWPL